MSDWLQWNVMFLCLEGTNMRFMIEYLEESHRNICYGTWAFTPETTIKNENLLFGRHEVVSIDAIGDVIIVMISPENSNPTDNVSLIYMPLPRVFHNHESKYAAIKGDAKRRTSEEILRLVNCYLPKKLSIGVGRTLLNYSSHYW